jgi:hypothetical protein
MIRDKSKCLSCGTLVDITDLNIVSMNTFLLEEEQLDGNFKRKVNLSFTDTAIDKVSSVMGGYVPFTSPTISKINPIRDQHSILQSAPHLPSSVDGGYIQDEIIQEKRVENISEFDEASEYFDKDQEGFLMSKYPDYKGKNKKVNQQRFSLLYVWAYFLFFQQPVAREHLNQAAKLNSLYDKNYSGYFSDFSKKFFVLMNGAFKLNSLGQSEVKNILSEIQDSDVKGNWNLNQRKSSKRSRITKEDCQSLDDWIEIKSRFDGFDTRILTTHVEYVLLAVYDITKELKVQEFIKSGLAYGYLIKRYKTIPIDKEKFRKILTNSKTYGKYFGRTADGSYYLTQEGERTVEKWLAK